MRRTMATTLRTWSEGRASERYEATFGCVTNINSRCGSLSADAIDEFT